VIRAGATSLMLCLLPIAATAQTTPGGAAPASQGPMIVERVHSGFLVAPDFKITEVDKKTSELAGGYAGWVIDDTIFVGGGGYWLANQTRDREMAYGGLIVQWLARANERFGFSAKALVGGGRATLSSTVSDILRLSDNDRTSIGRIDQDDLNRARIANASVRFRQDFFVAEPEVGVLLRLTRRLRLTGGAGYRFTAAEGRNDNRLHGAVGSVGLQIGGGS
jgi:hypothetical protein